MSGTETLFTPPTLLPRSSCSLDPVRFFLVSPSVLFLSHFSFCWPSYIKLSSYHNKTSKYLCHWSPGQQLRPSDDSVFWSVASDSGFFIPPHRVLWTSSLRSHLWPPSSSLASLALKGPFPTGLNCRSSEDSDVPFYRLRTSQLPGLWVSFLFLSAASFKHVLWVSLFLQWSLNRSHYSRWGLATGETRGEWGRWWFICNNLATHNYLIYCQDTLSVFCFLAPFVLGKIR